MTWDHTCNHRRLSRFFALWPVCHCNLNSPQAVADCPRDNPSTPDVSIPFHDMNNTQGGNQDHV